MKSIVKFKSIGMILLAAVGVTFVQCEKQALADPVTDQVTLEQRGGIDAEALCTCLTENYAKDPLSADEIAALTFMRQEEKLARDVYMALNEQYNQRIFTNIIRSEQQHMDAIGCLLTKYELADPVAGMEAGQFANEDLAALYSQLLEQGGGGLVSALQVGATIEDLDLNDLAVWLEKTTLDNEDVIAVFNELMRGSRNHLRAFVRNLGWNDASYTVQYLDEETYLAILESGMERGGTLCDGLCDGTGFNGNGNGQGLGTGECDGTGRGLNQGNNGPKGSAGNPGSRNGRNG